MNVPTSARGRSIGAGALWALAAAAVAAVSVALPASAAPAARPDHARPTVTAAAAPPTTGAVPTGAPAASGSPTRCTATNLVTVQAYVAQALSNRVTQLNALGVAVGAAADLTAADRSTLSSDVASELSGIQGLQVKLPADTTCPAVAADGRAMVVDFRVYVVMTPQVHLTVSADTESAVAARVAGLEPRLQAAITAAGQAGRNVAAAQAALTDLETQVTSAQQSGSGISTQVLAFTPASYPGCWATFRADRLTLKKGQQALRQVDGDLHKILNAVG
jgi:hypothetical protein